MNPELQRNIWLELTRGRVIAVPVILGALFLTLGLFKGENAVGALGGVAVKLYYGFTVLWGTWLAARAVVGEVRDRTWDGQRLSAISPWSMMWGKLLGSTIFVWYGGGLCLALAFLGDLAARGPGAALEEALWRVFLGVLAQSVTLLASLVAIRRGMGMRRVGTFLFQALGIAAAWSASGIWAAVRLPYSEYAVSTWWGMEFDSRAFLLGSLAVFSAWSILGNYRLMRTELQVRNTPIVALGFLGFLLVYVSGFGPDAGSLAGERWEAMPYAVIAFLTATAYAYLMVLLDPKDFVLYRWMAVRGAAGDLAAVATRLQSWMLAFLAAAVAALYIVLAGPSVETPSQVARHLNFDPAYKPIVISALFFCLRDLGIVLLFNASPSARRADLTAVAVIALVYLLPVAVLSSIGAHALMPAVLPDLLSPDWADMLWPLAEAALVWFLVAGRAASVRSGASMPG